MKKLIIFLSLVFLTHSLYAKEFDTYNLFNGTFQTVFPQTPIRTDNSSAFTKKNILALLPLNFKSQASNEEINKMVIEILKKKQELKSYSYTNSFRGLAIIAQKAPASSGNFGTKIQLDKIAKAYAKGRKIIFFSSV